MKYLSTISATILVLAAGAVAAQTVTPSMEATKEQLARHLNVDPNDFTLSELSDLACKIEAASSEAERSQILRAATEAETSGQEITSGDMNQLAAELGVNAADYTPEQLFLLKALVESDDCNVGDPAVYVKAGESLTPVGAEAKRQLALSLGVDPTAYTLDELAAMRFERDNDN